MYEWTQPYEDEYLKERIESVMEAQKCAVQNGKVLVSSYEQLWLPILHELPDIEYIGRERYRAPYGTFQPISSPLFYGALWFTPASGIELPPVLKDVKEWSPASAVIDLDGRMAKIQAGEIEITFANVSVSLSAHELLQEINRELVRTAAGVYVWRLEPVENSSMSVRHLYPDGVVPALSNAHTRADVTGYALLPDRPYQHTLVYVGLAAHKTSIESLWASLTRGRGACSLRGTSVIADGEVRMITQPLLEFGVLHAGLICRKALPGQWEASDDSAYALVFAESSDAETELQAVTLKRLQEALAFPIAGHWGKSIWEHGLEVGFIQRLETGGDCRGGVRIDLTKPWQELVQNMLERNILTI